jgi:hypothetical protein
VARARCIYTFDGDAAREHASTLNDPRKLA